MPDLETVDLHGVEIMAAGCRAHGRGSPPEGDLYDVAALEQLAAATNRAIADGEQRSPVKLGHNAEQRILRESGLVEDGVPAGGWLHNLRVVGDKLVTDLKRVPKQLADLVHAGAYRTRSVELRPLVGQQTQTVYGTVASGLALLGATAPAFQTLGDIAAYYAAGGDDEGAPEEGVWFSDGHAVSKPADTARREDDPNAGADVPELKLTEEQAKQFATALGIEGDAIEVAHYLQRATKLREELDAAVAERDAAKAAAAAGESKDMSALETRLAATEEKLRVSERKQVVETAIRQGRIEPARRGEFEKLYDANPDACTLAVSVLPVQPDLAKTFGSDDDGADTSTAQTAEQAEKNYEAFAGAFGFAEVTL